MTATPATGWVFDHWEGSCTGTVNPCVVTVDGAESVTAYFKSAYTLTVNTVGLGAVTKSPYKATYNYGDVITLTPVGDEGWSFSSWSGDLTGNTNPATITMNANKTVTATFTNGIQNPPYTLAVTQPANGTITPGTASYESGAVVALTATPADHYHFVEWTGACSGQLTATCSVTMNAPTAVSAVFAIDTYVMTVTQSTGGTINKSTATYDYGTVVTLNATPAANYSFGQWNGDCTGELTTNCTLTMDGDKSVSATFNQNTFTLTITYNPTEGGGTTTPPVGVYTYGYGTVVNVLPYPAQGYKFDHWAGSCSGNTNCSLTMSANRTVTAYFTPLNYNLTVAVDPAGSGTTLPSVGVNPLAGGSVVEVTATPTDGFVFSHWSGACIHSDECNVTIDMDKSVTAHFLYVTQQQTLNITQVTGGTITASPAGPYYLNDTVVLTAKPDTISGYSFLNWTGDCAGQGNTCSLTMFGPKQVSAVFSQAACYVPKDLVGAKGNIREDFESMTGWTVSGTGTGYSATVDPVNFKSGNSSVKLTTPSGTGWVRILKTVNWNLSAPEERGNFRLWVYVHGTGEPTDFSIALSNDANFANSFITWYNAPFKFRYRPGWNLVNIRTSDWLVGGGAPSWSNPIVRIRITVNGTSTSSFSLDGLESGPRTLPAVVLTFDDGVTSLYTQVYPYMNTEKVRGTSFVITNGVTDTIDRYSYYVTWQQLQELYSAGWTIGNHTVDHTNLTSLSLADQEAKLRAARLALNDHGMTNVDYVAYPFGVYNADTLTAMANLGMQNGRPLLYFENVSPLTNPYLIGTRSVGKTTSLDTVKGYINRAKSRGEILVLTLHDIATSPTDSGWYPDQFKAMVDYIISQGIPILTMDDLNRIQSEGIYIPAPTHGSCGGGFGLEVSIVGQGTVSKILTPVPFCLAQV